MEITKNEVERLFPSVYITLVSILLGFAVEDVINRLREIAPVDVFTAIAATGILTGIIAAWIGWSFVSMTQERLPNVWDAIHVFFMAFCFYALISTLGTEVWWVFMALAIYNVFGTLAAIYNGNILLQSLSAPYDWRFFRSNIMITVLPVVVYSVGSWMSLRQMLPRSAETSLITYYVISNIAWLYFLQRKWSHLVRYMK